MLSTAVVHDLWVNLSQFEPIWQKSAFEDLTLVTKEMRLELQHAGVHLIDVPSDGKEATVLRIKKKSVCEWF